MITIFFWASMLVNTAHADDECQARYDLAHEAYLARQPHTSMIEQESRIVRRANSPEYGERELTRTGREVAARQFAMREYERCRREGV